MSPKTGAKSPLRVALFGHPLGHSRSPALFEALAASGGPRVDYRLRPTSSGEVPAALAALREGALDAANVTVPHKLALLSFLDELTPRAKQAGAVNVIARRPGGRLLGDNSDGAGFLAGLAEYGLEAEGPALVLGSGGAARGVAAALAERLGAPLVVARDPERVRREWGPLAGGVLAWDAGELVERARAARTIVQATPLGTAPDTGRQPPLPDAALGPGQLVVDLVYNPWETAFLARARALGARALNGWPMLVHQAALALELWLGEARGDELVRAARRLETRDPRRGERG